ncbi:hypothetical protein ES703_91453 [subsurface metagenome]
MFGNKRWFHRHIVFSMLTCCPELIHILGVFFSDYINHIVYGDNSLHFSIIDYR